MTDTVRVPRELVGHLIALVAMHDKFMRAQGGLCGNHADAYYLVATRYDEWAKARFAAEKITLAMLAPSPQGQGEGSSADADTPRGAEGDVVAALQDLLVAVTYAAPARTFAGVMAYEARVPVEFVERADAALGGTRQQAAPPYEPEWITHDGGPNPVPGATEAFDALDLADRLIERAYGGDTPSEWNVAYRGVANARRVTEGVKP